MALRKAVKSESRLRMAIVGPAGSGKTFSALKLAAGLAGNKRVALFDTEHGSAAKYADHFDFDVDNILPPFHPDKFCQAIRDAAQAGYGVVILDSLSHAWNGEGGMLDIVEGFAKRMKNPNSFAAWKDATPIQNRLTEAIVGADIHVIVTMRSKTEYVLQTNERGQQQPRKVGMAAIQRSEYDYEFDVVMEMDAANNGIITKTRCSELNEGVFPKPGKQVTDILTKWLSGNPAPAQQPIVTQTPEQRQPIAIESRTNGATHVEPVAEEVQPAIELSADVSNFIANLLQSAKTPPELWKWAADNKHTENEHSARTRWTAIVKDQGGYKPEKFTAIATAFVAHYLAKPVAA